MIRQTTFGSLIGLRLCFGHSTSAQNNYAPISKTYSDSPQKGLAFEGGVCMGEKRRCRDIEVSLFNTLVAPRPHLRMDE